MSKSPLLIRGHAMEERVVPEPRESSKSVLYLNQILNMMKARWLLHKAPSLLFMRNHSLLSSPRMDNHSKVFYQLYRLIEFSIERDPRDDGFQLLPFIYRGTRGFREWMLFKEFMYLVKNLSITSNSPMLVINKPISNREFYFLEISKAFSLWGIPTQR